MPQSRPPPTLIFNRNQFSVEFKHLKIIVNYRSEPHFLSHLKHLKITDKSPTLKPVCAGYQLSVLCRIDYSLN